MADLPTGTVTFLFTDIEGSTRRWEQHPQTMPDALARHDAILREATEACGGVVFRTVGDAFCTAFASAPAALRTALAAQRALHIEPWGETGPLRVRMALHTGAVELRDDEYQGQPLNRIARLLTAGHGGQTLLSAATQELVRDHLPPDVELRDTGTHRLKDLTRPEQIFQIITPDLPTDFPPLKTLDRRPHNLPAQPTALIGREREVASVCALVHRSDVRLVTLTGPGGTGKTRLALQAAAELIDEVADGVSFVTLAPISAPDLVATTIAQTLGVRETGAQPLRETLKDYLREKQTLLLLDNFEQVADAAPLVAELLAAAKGLKVLVTSRVALHLSGEHEIAVPPLSLPDRAHTLSLERLTQYEAVRLFIERAQAVNADFAVTNANAPAVAEICVRLDGLPLAIELAAARSKLFSPQALLARLGSQLKLLTGGARDLPARQQTIRNTIDWSYHLLDAGEQILFARLGVFVGGWTVEAAEAVCNAAGDLPADVLDGLASLLDQSLLRQMEETDGEPHFTMLETIREYALERLAARGEVDDIRQQHASFFLALAERAEPALHGPQQRGWLNRLEQEHDNLRAALGWALERDDAAVALRLGGALGRFWETRGYLIEGRRWLEMALALPGSSAVATIVRAKAIGVLGSMTHHSDYAVTRSLYTESLALFREVGDKHGIALLLSDLGWIMLYERRTELARSLFAESVAIWRELKDTWGLAAALHGLGAAIQREDYVAARPILEESVALFRSQGDKGGLASSLNQLGVGEEALAQGDYTRAGVLYEESLALCRALDDKGFISVVLGNLGDIARYQGDYRRAAALYEECVAVARQHERKSDIMRCLAGFAGLATARGQPERAVRLLAAEETLLATIGLSVSVWPTTHADYERNVAAARAQLDEATFAAVWAAGRTMTLEQAIAYALDPLPELPAPAPAPPQPTAPTGADPAGLTAREVEVLRLIAQGLTDAQVAERLVVSTHTVHAHLRSIYGKLDVTSRAAATRFAVDHQLV